MFMVGLIAWWYGRGWVEQWRRNGGMLLRTLDFFSVDQLLSTLFAPFRQISVGTGRGVGFSAALSALIDRLVSRIIGSIIRLFTILIGVAAITLQAVYVAVVMAFWWTVPLLPIVGLVMFLIGWVPSV